MRQDITDGPIRRADDDAAFAVGRRDLLKVAGGVGAFGVAGTALNLIRAEAAPAERKLPGKWHETAGVLVVGSGFAGLAAAAAAAGASRKRPEGSPSGTGPGCASSTR